VRLESHVLKFATAAFSCQVMGKKLESITLNYQFHPVWCMLEPFDPDNPARSHDNATRAGKGRDHDVFIRAPTPPTFLRGHQQLSNPFLRG